MVGERGPELAYLPPAQIYTATQTASMLDTTALVSEVRALRQELAQLRTQQSAETGAIISANAQVQADAANTVVRGVSGAASQSAWQQQNRPVLA